MPTQEEIQSAVRTLSREKLLAFSVAMDPEFLTPWHLKLLAAKLEAVERGEIKRLMVFMPPRHGKSLLCSQLFPSWFIGRNPKKQVIAATYGYSLASKFGRDVRNLVQEERFRNIFPDVTLAEDSQAKDHFNTNHKGIYIATGVGGAMTGYGADLLLIDDPIKGRRDADSETFRNNTEDWYNSTAYTRLMPGAAIILIQTRWHDDDLAGRILENEGDKWEVVNIPAITEDCALWPERYTLEDLLSIKSAIGTDEFSCLYQQNPVNLESQEFKRSYFKYYRDDECPGNLRIFTTVDPAISKKASADESCVMTVGVAPDNSKFILKYTNAKLDPSELIEAIFSHYDEFNPVQVGIETVAYQEALSHFLKIEMRRRNKFMNIKEIKTHQDKEAKIRGLIAHYKAGAVYHRAGFCETLEQQLLRFPKSAKDDVMDALAMQQELWSAPLYTKWKPENNGKSLKQLIKEEGLLARV